MKTSEVTLKDGTKTHLIKDNDRYNFIDFKEPVILTRAQIYIIFFLLIFITLTVILLSIFNTLYLQEIGNAILAQISKLASGYLP